MAFVLEPTVPLDAWLGEISSWLERSPGFFNERPVILNVKEIGGVKVDLVGLVDGMRTLGVTVMALEGAPIEWLGADLPPAISGGRAASMIEVLPQPATRTGKDADETPPPAARAVKDRAIAAKVDNAAKAEAPASKPQPGLVITHPIRSGQTIVHEGDVTVVGSVASGAEIVAAGSIHIYGTLRGRAVAGSTGNNQARIFARRFEAELIAIDGVFRTAEDLGAACHGRAVQAFIEGETLKAIVLE